MSDAIAERQRDTLCRILGGRVFVLGGGNVDRLDVAAEFLTEPLSDRAVEKIVHLLSREARRLVFGALALSDFKIEPVVDRDATYFESLSDEVQASVRADVVLRVTQRITAHPTPDVMSLVRVVEGGLSNGNGGSLDGNGQGHDDLSKVLVIWRRLPHEPWSHPLRRDTRVRSVEQNQPQIETESLGAQA